MTDKEAAEAGQRATARALVGVGIGSAAIAAALIYAGRLKPQKKGNKPSPADHRRSTSV